VPDASYQRKYGPLGLVKLLGPDGALLTSHSLKLAQSPSIPDHPVQLGGNLYAKDRVPVKRLRGDAAPPTDAEHDAAASAAAASELPTAPPPAPPPAPSSPHASPTGARRCRVRVSCSCSLYPVLSRLLGLGTAPLNVCFCYLSDAEAQRVAFLPEGMRLSRSMCE
jgi:hypothetical protein